MARIFLVRHGEPTSIWGEPDVDPGLSPAGHAQAARAADTLAGQSVTRTLSSPMRRCRETADPFGRLSGRLLRLEGRVGEVMTPADAQDRRAWLQACFPWRGGEQMAWDDMAAETLSWRADLLTCLQNLDEDTVVFTHFVAINAVVGAALERSETVVCKPDFASITEVAVEGGVLRLISLGAQMSEGEVR